MEQGVPVYSPTKSIFVTGDCVFKTARDGRDKAGQDGARQTRMDMNHGKKEKGTFGRPRGLKPSRQEVQFSSIDIYLVLDMPVPRGQEEKRRR